MEVGHRVKLWFGTVRTELSIFTFVVPPLCYACYESAVDT